MSNFADQVRSVLSDTMNLPAEFLSMIPQYVAQNPVPVARTSGTRIASGNNSSSVATTGTTFAGGADLLASSLAFTADGKTTYVVRAFAPDWTLSVTTTNMQARLNLDGADAGIMQVAQGHSTAGGTVPFCAVGYFTPAQGSHTVNVRVLAGAAATVTVEAGAGGAGTRLPIFVTLEIA